MTLRQACARIAGAAAVAAAIVALVPGLVTRANAQTAPYSAYGVGLQSGQVVEVFDGGVSCGSVTADASGNWLIQIADSAPCSPHDGDTLTFTLDGQATTATETWMTGGAPSNISSGITLTVVATPTPTPTAAPAGPGTFNGTIADHGISPVLFNGGTVDQAVSAAGSGLNSMWIYSGGSAIGYTVGAPDFVNAAFLALFPHSVIPSGEIVILVKA